MSRRPAALVALVLLTVTLASCGREGPGADEARLDVEGRATLTDADGLAEEVTGSRTLSFGDSVRMEEGSATLELAAGQRYELRAGDAATELVVGAPPRLVAGDVLVTDGFPASVAHGTTTLVAQGALKVSSGVPAATAYAGRTRISGAGDLGEVLGLRQVVLTSSAVPEPLAYDAADPWDRRFLGDAVALGERLEAFARGFTGDLGAGARPASYYQSILPALAEEREFGADLVGARPAGETLVGAAIAVQGQEGTFRERWAEIFSFRDAGAAWGLVALDQGVSSTPVIETIELALATPAAPAAADDPAPTTTAPPGSTTTLRDGPTTTSTTVPPTTTTVPPGSPGVLEPVLTPVEDLLGDVLRALGLG